MEKDEFLGWAAKGIEIKIKELEARLNELRGALHKIRGGNKVKLSRPKKKVVPPAKPKRKKRKLSKKARKAISVRMTKRWAEWRKKNSKI